MLEGKRLGRGKSDWVEGRVLEGKRLGRGRVTG